MEDETGTEIMDKDEQTLTELARVGWVHPLTGDAMGC